MVLTHFSKAFDCIPHDILTEKLSAYGLGSDSFCYIYSYLKDRKQCVQINNKDSKFDSSSSKFDVSGVSHLKVQYLERLCLTFFQ